MAFDEAAVRLSAVDDVSGPAAAATAGLQKYQASVNALVDQYGRAIGPSSSAAVGIEKAAAASQHSVSAHTSAHKALNLVSGSLVELAGGSAAAEGGIRVLDSVMFQMAMSGGSVSIAFVAIIAAAAAVGYAFKSAAEETKKQAEAMDRMTESAIKAVSQLSYLDSVQKSVAGVGGAQLSARVLKLKTEIGELTEKMKENAAAGKAGQATGLGGAFSAVGNAFSGGLVGTDAREAANAAQVRMAGQLRVLQEELKKTQHEQDELTTKSARYVSVLRDSGDPLAAEEAKMNRVAAAAESIGRALGDTSATMAQVGEMANKLGVDYVRAASIMSQQTQVLQAGVMNLASTFGTMIGRAITSGKDAWREGLKAMISAVFDAATGVVMAAAIMNQAITAALIPGTFVGIIAMVAVLQALKQVALAAIGGASQQAAAQAQAATGITPSSVGSGVGVSGSPTGPGGTPISSSQSQVTNNVVVNLPIQALDVSSVSDIQLKSLANRVGRVLAEAAGQGQFSLAGA